MSRKKTALIAGILTLVLAATCTFLLVRQDSGNTGEHFYLLDGTPKTLADIQGNATLLHFWSTTCVYCRSEMPDMIKTHHSYAKQGLRTIAIAMRHDRPSRIAKFAKTQQLPFILAYDDNGSVATRWGNINTTPTTLLLDKEGKIVRKYVGVKNFQQLHQDIEATLGTPS